ncbi:hypothetical protein BC936DRAFT_144097 [Jimgerdemannia flammicorona]|uniref:Uncharacterized protein n=1 Tax=Jimgerdemannia flammicorona TaxID=994334 RepID=A0A432ZYB1_9FUNG|nr:hypothetical protein BC936DRAFT_144097 [Jimgerdemannia flammicorona]
MESNHQQKPKSGFAATTETVIIELLQKMKPRRVHKLQPRPQRHRPAELLHKPHTYQRSLAY